MRKIKKRLILSFILNIIMIILFISSIIIEIIKIHKDPYTIYQNVWGLFRYFTFDGNLLTFIFNSIICFKQYQALKLSNDEKIKEKIINHFLYIISLISVCNDIIIFVVVVIIFLPFGGEEWRKGLVGTYNTSTVHIVIPILLAFRFLFLDNRKRDLKLYEKFYGGIPMLIYGTIMYILCGEKIFTSFDDFDGDGKIPYPFFDVYHQKWYLCFLVAPSIFIFGFRMSFLFDFLNKKFEKLIWPYNSTIVQIGQEIERDEEN